MPTDPVSIAVALADKIDTLVGFWAIDEKPTGSKDPYALRRAALGVIRIVLDNAIRLHLSFLLQKQSARLRSRSFGRLIREASPDAAHWPIQGADGESRTPLIV